ncbi:VOC family protein [uncultured Nocardioides sp.]|uniref:VOC family protein n=1 Tax=uncultured Nocardioides sp. TaxID=198441 RepID=UPI0025FD7EED|nr:VOC family protein [uncultured Nocardioides sp.]
MALALFAGIPVSDYAAVLPWYVRLLGRAPDFLAHATEAVWDLGADQSLYVVELPEHAGHARVTAFVDDLDAVVGAITGRGIEPALRETYGNGVRKITFRDADGNEIGFGGAPLG